MLSVIGEILRFMKAYRKFWLAPLIFLLLAVGGFLVAVQGSAVAPFIYAIF